MKKYLLITAIFLVLVSGCSKSEPKDEVPEITAPEEKVLEKIDESKPFIYVEIPENAKDLNDYRYRIEWLPNENMDSQIYPYLKEKDSNAGTERIVLNFKSSDAQALQIKLDEKTQNSLDTTDKYPPEQDYGGTWASFQVADYAESESLISFTVLNDELVFNSDVSTSELTSYVFDKSNGSLLNHDDVIERSGYTTIDFETAFIKAVEVYNESLLEEESYRALTYKPEYFVEDFDSSTLPEELLNTSGLYVHIKPEEGIVVNEDGSLTVIYEYKYFYGLSPGTIYYGFVTIPAP